MKAFTTLSLLAATVAAVPVVQEKRAADMDATILNYALTLEHLESAFYSGGLATFSEADFQKAGFGGNWYKNLKEIASDEATHVSFLTSALQAANYTATAACTYDFGYKTPTEFVQIASILEGVGVTAYLGAAASIVDKTYLTAAGSILTVEARHNAYIRSIKNPGQSPFPQPFDVPLDPMEVYTLAAPFITACPKSNPSLGVTAFPMLALDANTAVPAPAGRVVDIATVGGYTLKGPVYGAFMSVTGPVFVPTTIKAGGKGVKVTIPKGVAGQSYFILSSSSTEVTDDTTVAGPAIVPILAPYLAPM